jgi:thiamine-monophosphate kinase
MKNELERIAMLAARFGAGGGGGDGGGDDVELGIGDDAAVVRVGGERVVWTIDAQVEGTHFRREWLSWADVGFRSFMAAASDLAAMGASPIAALSSLVLPADFDDASLDALAAGQAEAAKLVGASVVGGNLARGGELSVTTTLLGRALSEPKKRSGAKPGDGLYLGGAVGLAAAGLAYLQDPKSVQIADAAVCIEAWRRPRALIELGQRMGAATSAVDVSDGLARDAWHVADASGVVIVIDEALLRATTALELRLEWMLGGGEDYALLVTSPAAMEGFSRIGSIEGGDQPGVLLCTREGSRRSLPRAGVDHFGA